MKNVSLVLMLFFVAAFGVNELQAQTPACCDIQNCCKLSDKKGDSTTAEYQVVKASDKGQLVKAETKSACCASTSCPLSLCKVLCGSKKTAQQENSKTTCSAKLAAVKNE